MSQENVAVARRILEATDRKDWPEVLADLDAEVEIDDTDIPEATGGDSFLAWVARWSESQHQQIARAMARRAHDPPAMS